MAERAKPIEPSRVEIALVRATRAVKRAFNVRLAEIKLNMTEAGLLTFVDDHGSLTQRQLADLLHISRVSAGSFIDGLEARDLVRREADPSDRRVWQIKLTPAGRELVESFRAIDRDLSNDLRVGFTRAERHLLAELLDRLRANAEAVVRAPQSTGAQRNAKAEANGRAGPRRTGSREDPETEPAVR